MMDKVTKIEYTPANPDLVQNIVSLLKSQGIFDHFRKECLLDVDTKPAYQNLCHRVNGQVESYLSNVIWKSDLNKNKIRNGIRRYVNDCTFVDSGITRIVDRLVNSKVNSVLVPKVADMVYDHLGIEKINWDLDLDEMKDSNVNERQSNSDMKPETSTSSSMETDAPIKISESQVVESKNTDDNTHQESQISNEPINETKSPTEEFESKLDVAENTNDSTSLSIPLKSDIDGSAESDVIMLVSEAVTNSKTDSEHDMKIDNEDDKIFSDMERICGAEGSVPDDRKLSNSSDIPKTPTINYDTSDDSENPSRKSSDETRQDSNNAILDILDTSYIDSLAEKIAADNKEEVNAVNTPIVEKSAEKENLAFKDRENVRDKDRDRDREKDKDKERERDSNKHKSSKHRDRKHSEHRSDRDRKSSSSKNDKDHKDRSYHDSKHHSDRSRSEKDKDRSHDDKSRDHKKDKSNSSSHRDERSKSSHGHSRSESRDERKRNNSSRPDSDKDKDRDKEKSKHRKDESKKSRSHCNSDEKNMKNDRTSSDRDSNGPSSSSHRGSSKSEKLKHSEKHKRSSSPTSSSVFSTKNKKHSSANEKNTPETNLFDSSNRRKDSNSNLDGSKKPKIAKNAADIQRVVELRKLHDKRKTSSELRKDSTEVSDQKFAGISKMSSNNDSGADSRSDSDSQNVELFSKDKLRLSLEKIDTQYDLKRGSCRITENGDIGLNTNDNYTQIEDDTSLIDSDTKINGIFKSSSKRNSRDKISKNESKTCLLDDMEDVKYFEVTGSNEEFKKFVEKKIKESQQVYLENFSVVLKCSPKCDEIFRRDLGAVVKRRGKPVLLPSPVKYNSVILNNNEDNDKGITMKISKSVDIQSPCNTLENTESVSLEKTTPKRKTLGIKRKISNSSSLSTTAKMKKSSNSESAISASNESSYLENHFSDTGFDSSNDKIADLSKQPDFDDSSSCSRSSLVSLCSPSTPSGSVVVTVKKQKSSSITKQIDPKSKRKQFYYDEGDLYKPRPSFLASSRRSRTSLLDKSQ